MGHAQLTLTHTLTPNTVQVTGGKGAKVPADGRTIKELYSKSDEKVTWNLYKHTPNKVWTDAPGPKLLTSANARRSHARTFLT
jgi:hypothetical protein